MRYSQHSTRSQNIAREWGPIHNVLRSQCTRANYFLWVFCGAFGCEPGLLPVRALLPAHTEKGSDAFVKLPSLLCICYHIVVFVINIHGYIYCVGQVELSGL